MGKNVLDRGLLPDPTAEKPPSARQRFDFMWAMISYHAHRFGGRPIAEMLVSWTMIMLADRGVAPTIGELATATGMPRATVSRYVNHQIEVGWIEERVDATNRRRRELLQTELGAQELEHMMNYFHGLFQDMMAANSVDGGLSAGDDLLEKMHALTERIVKDIA
jgi:DNA-binding MarR family transcriptional regulator